MTFHLFRWPLLLALIASSAALAPAPASPCFPGASTEEAFELIDLEASVPYDSVLDRFFGGRSDAKTTRHLLNYLASESEYVRKRGLNLLERWIVHRDGPPGILTNSIVPAVTQVIDGIVGNDPNNPLRVQAEMTMWTVGLIMRKAGPDRLAYIRRSSSPDSPHRDEIVRRASRELGRIGVPVSIQLLREYQEDGSLSRQARAEATLALWVAEAAEALVLELDHQLDLPGVQRFERVGVRCEVSRSR